MTDRETADRDESKIARDRDGLPTASPSTGYELVVCQNGKLELRDPEDPDCWITTDSPAEITR